MKKLRSLIGGLKKIMFDPSSLFVGALATIREIRGWSTNLPLPVALNQGDKSLELCIGKEILIGQQVPI